MDALLAERLGLVVIGAQKAGTSSLLQYLKQCDGLGVIPGLHGQRIDLFGPGANPAYLAMTREWVQKQDAEAMIAQVRADYYVKPLAIEEMASTTRATFILTWRDPVDRLYSHYAHAVKYGRTLRPLRAWVETEEGRYGIQLSSYWLAIKDTLPHLEPSRLIMMHMKETTQPEVLSRLAQSVGFTPPAAPVIKIANQARVPRNFVLNRLARSAIDVVAPTTSRLRNRLDGIRSRRLTKPGRPDPIDPADRAHFDEVFREDFAAFNAFRESHQKASSPRVLPSGKVG